MLALERKNTIQQAARRLITAPTAFYDAEFRAWSEAISLLWDDQNPQDILNLLGVHAKELFELSATKAAHLMEVVAMGCTKEEAAKRNATIAAIVAKVKPYTVHPDGSITIN